MKFGRCTIVAVAAALLLVPRAAFPHPVPFSYVDATVSASAVDIAVVVHAFDVAHDLGTTPEDLLSPDGLARRADAINALVSGRLRVSADGEAVTGATWTGAEPLLERQALRLRARLPLVRMPGSLTFSADMFPYDPQHRTFLNVYESGTIAAQAILERGRPRFDYFTGTRQGKTAVLRRFIPAGIHHILIGPDHLLFLAGLLLLGGTTRQLLLVVTAFTIAHSITLSLAALRLVMPPQDAIEPAIALSVVYVGADNLLVRAGGRDTRPWIAFAFGLIHGFGFANVLRGMDLPTRALGWTLFGFNLGVELGQLAVVLVAALVFAHIRSRSEKAARALAVAGSAAIIVAGTYWFVDRVFFSGGTA